MTLTVVSNPAHGGRIAAQPSLDPDLANGATKAGTYYPTDNVTVTATASFGYRFVNWTGNVSEIEDTSQRTIVVAMDKYFAEGEKKIEITANFKKTVPWAWVAGILAALLLTALALATVMLIRRRKKHQADTEAP